MKTYSKRRKGGGREGKLELVKERKDDERGEKTMRKGRIREGSKESVNEGNKVALE